MTEFITHDEWVKLSAQMLDQLANHMLLWDTRMKVQQVGMGTIMVLPPEETVPPLRSLP